jgi:hypothetical protein
VSPTLNRYCCGRDGDHLMGVPFECDLCLFRNVCRKNPVFGNHRDQFTLTSIRQVQLDVMWARETHTMATNWARAKADYEMALRQFSILPEQLLLQLGLEEVRDRVGMLEALMTLATSLRLGRNTTHIQWDTMRKTRTWLNNAHDAGCDYSCETVVGLDRAKQYVTSGHTSSKWFGRFMKGACMRMGMIRRQNKALTSALAIAICAEAEMRWHSPIGNDKREELEDTIIFMMAAFGAGLQGEEVSLILLDGLLTFWDKSRADVDSHVMLTLKGRFKEEVDERWHLVPVSNTTRSGLPFRRWMERVLHRRVNLHTRDTGWLFQDQQGARLKFGHYNSLFRVLVDQARERYPRLLLEAVDTGNFSLWRSPRRGAVLETTNQDVSEKVIDLINPWRKKEVAKGSEAGLAMRQVYTQVRSTLPAMLKFSKAL